MATAWEKRAPSNSVIELYPCSFQSSQNAFPETEFIVASIRRVVEQPKEALRLTVNTALQTIPSSFPRRLSQYLHRCPVFVGGHIRIAANTYTLSSFSLSPLLTPRSLPSGDIVTCLTDTTILFKQTDPATSSSSSQLQELDSLPPLHCPLPGLEDCYRVLVTTILYHRLFQREIESGSLRLFKGLLLSGDHGLGKTHIVHPLSPSSLDPRRRRLLSAISPPLLPNPHPLLPFRRLRLRSPRHRGYYLHSSLP